MSWVYHLNNWFYRNVIIWDKDYWVKSWLGKGREECKLHCRSFGENSLYTDFELREGVLLSLGRGGMDYSRNRGSRYLQQENVQGVMEAEIRLQEVGSEWTEATGKTTFWKKKYDWRNKQSSSWGEHGVQGELPYLFNKRTCLNVDKKKAIEKEILKAQEIHSANKKLLNLHHWDGNPTASKNDNIPTVEIMISVRFQGKPFTVIVTPWPVMLKKLKLNSSMKTYWTFYN